MTRHEQILHLLRSPDQTQGELLDGSDCQTYAELNCVLQDLQRQKLITAHFDGVLRYRLSPIESTSPRFFWQQQ